MVHTSTTMGFWLTSLAVFLGSLLFLRIPAAAGRIVDNQVSKPRPLQSRSLAKDVGAGLLFLKRRKDLLGSTLIYGTYVFGLNGINAVFYPYVDSVLKAGPAVFGLSVSCYFAANFLVGILLLICRT